MEKILLGIKDKGKGTRENSTRYPVPGIQEVLKRRNHAFGVTGLESVKRGDFL